MNRSAALWNAICVAGLHDRATLHLTFDAGLRAWLAVRTPAEAPEMFLNARGKSFTRAGFEYILAKHVKTAKAEAPALATKGISPHELRHSCAMHALPATHDVRKVSLWLGHATLQSKEIYLRADPTEKLQSLAAMTAASIRRGRFHARP